MRRLVILAASMSLLLAACGSADGSDPGRTDATGGQADITVSGASSLTDAFGDIGTAFEEQNPGLTITFNFGPSDGLATQINDGAPVDVFASASPTWMDSVQVEGPGVSDRADFATNRLTIIVPRDNPAGIAKIGDLAEEGVQLVIAAQGVPAGDYTRKIFENAGISQGALTNVVSNAEDVRSVVMSVASGEADAGVVYVTDVTPDVTNRITQIEIPERINAIATYPIAVVNDSKETGLAARFVDYVLGPGQQTLADYGFLPA